MVDEFPANPAYRSQLANVSHCLADCLHSQPEQAEKLLRRNLELTDAPYSLMWTYNSLAVLYASQNRQTEAERSYRQALEQSDNIEVHKAEWFRSDRAYTVVWLAHSIVAQGRHRDAEKTFKRALAIWQDLVADYPSVPGYQAELASCYVELARNQKTLKKTAQAEQSYRQAIAVFEQLVRKLPTNPAYQQTAFDQSFVLGRLLRQAGHIEEAQQGDAEAAGRSERQASDSPSRLDHWQGLVRSHIKLAEILLETGKKPEGLAAYKKAMEIQEKLQAQYGGKAAYQRDLAQSHVQAARLFQNAARPGEAEKLYRLAIAGYDKLIAEHPEPDLREELAETCMALVPILAGDKGQVAQAEPFYRQAVAIWEKLATEFPKMQRYRQGQGDTHYNWALATLYKAPKIAAKAFRQALVLRQQAVSQSPTSLGQRLALLHCQTGLTEVLVNRQTGPKWAEEAQRLCRDILEQGERIPAEFHDALQRPLPPHTPTFPKGEQKDARVILKYILAVAYQHQGKALEGLARYRDAEAALRQSERLIEELLAKFIDGQSMLRNTRKAFARILARHLNRPEEGERVYRANVDAMEAIMKKLPRNAYWRETTAWVHRDWARTMRDTGRYRKAVEAFRAAIELGEELCAKFPGANVNHAFIVSDTCYLLAELLLTCPDLKLRDPAEAAALYSKAIELEPDNKGFRERRGMAYLAIGESEKARQDFEKYLELLTTAVMDKPDDWSTWNIRGVGYSKLRRWQDAIADFTHALELPKVDEGLVRGNRAFCRCEQGRWRDAAADFVRIIELRPANSNSHYQHALAQLGSGDIDGYRQSCAAMRTRFLKSTNPTDAQWVSWTCALAPDALSDFAPVLALVEKAGKTAVASASFAMYRGSLLYRAGRWQEALDSLKEAERQTEKATGGIRSSPAYAWYFLAMAHHQLGNAKEARRWLDKATAWTERVLKEDAKAGQRLPWNRRLTLRLLRQEAEALIDTETKNKEPK